MKFIFILGLVLGAPLFAQADWSCECDMGDEGVWIIDGTSKDDAAQKCKEDIGGEVLRCESQGRGDRKPLFFGESVLVPANPGGVDVCRNFIAYHLKIDELDITLGGRTPENMTFLFNGRKVGTMIYNDDGSEAALCTVL